MLLRHGGDVGLRLRLEVLLVLVGHGEDTCWRCPIVSEVRLVGLAGCERRERLEGVGALPHRKDDTSYMYSCLLSVVAMMRMIRSILCCITLTHSPRDSLLRLDSLDHSIGPDWPDPADNSRTADSDGPSGMAISSPDQAGPGVQLRTSDFASSALMRSRFHSHF
jgi:hypothetical protein